MRAVLSAALTIASLTPSSRRSTVRTVIGHVAQCIPSTRRTLAAVERQHVITTLERFGGNRSATAKALGIGDNTLWRKLKAYGVPSAR